MFFRREAPHEFTFAERIANLKPFGLAVTTNGPQAKVSRDGIGAVVEDRSGQRPHVNRAGLLVGDQIGLLVNGGYQMFWKMPDGRLVPTQATHLKNLHSFEEDLREGLGLSSLYNESLGTTSDLHMYDRVEHRDEGDVRRPWEDRPLSGA